MKNTTSTLLLFTTLMIATSCGGNSSSGAPADSSTSGVLQEEPKVDAGPGKVIGKNGVTFYKRRAVELNADFSNLEEVKNNLNSFIIRAEFERPLDSISYLRCPKIIGGNDDTATVAMSEGTTAKEIKIELSENDLQLDVNCQIISARKEISSAKYSFKKSLLVEKVSKLSSFSIGTEEGELQLDRLILSNGTLLIGDRKATLNVEDAYFNNGVLGTFTDEEIAPDPFTNRSGRDGGSLIINAKNSYGSLVAQMIGGNGNDQVEMPEPKKFAGIMDDPAKDSITARKARECQPRLVRPVIKSLPPSIGGPGFDPCRHVSYDSYCAKNADRGNPGTTGDNGYPGNPGGKTGKLIFTTENVGENFTLKFDIRSGEGGRGGEAGKGSNGGNGGRASEKCGAGAQGEQGASGQQGVQGPKGEVEVSCYEIKSAKQITCSKQ